MRSNIALWWLLLGFFLIIDIVYTGWSILAHPDKPWPEAIEWVGTVALLFGAFMSVMIGFYISRVHKAQGGELPQDVLTADIDDDDPELGHFSPWSWWPLMLGGALALVFLGLAVGVWVAFIGAPLVLIAIVGWNYEYYRNNFAR